MIADIQTAPDPLECDLCIIGGGAAGITIARQFLSYPYRVILLEGGGLQKEASVQSLYSGSSVGEHYYELHECRSRYFGGGTNCWGGILTPLNEIDFRRRSWVPWSGWPFDSTELLPYLRRAHEICDAGPFVYDARAWKMAGIPPADFDPDRFHPFVWHFNNRSRAQITFGTRFRAELRRASNIQVFLHANATELLTDPSGRSVERVRVRTLEGQTRHVRARIFVLACGGIENARVLLASDSHYPNGLGNHRDLVGRFFQEHVQAPCATLCVPEGQSHAACYSRLTKLGGTFCSPGLVLAPAAQETYHTLNGCLAVEPFHDPDGPFLTLQSFRDDLKARRIGPQTFNLLWRVVRQSPQLVPLAWQRLVQRDRPQGDPHRFIVYARGEQAPNPDSRVLLSDDVDALGMRRVVLDWRTTPLDRKAIRLMARFAVDEFARLGLGQVVPEPWLLGEEWPETLVGGPHHMGTTRMSDDESTGVVDRHCRVHRLDGLFVAGSSVFPTGGHANPTLTILALALRLADHLRARLLSPSATAQIRTPVETTMN